MISAKEAAALIREHFFDLTKREFSLLELNGKTLAQDLLAERDQPPFDRVAMDGIAVKWDGKCRTFPLEDIQRAGEATKRLKNEKAALEVMTGAPLPQGTDTVVPYEVVTIENGSVIIDADTTVKLQQNIHFKGSDYKEGDVVMSSGGIIRSPGVAVVASQGKQAVVVLELPKVAIITTGDELVDPGNAIEDYQIRRSNPYALALELKSLGIPQNQIDLFHLKDNRDEIYSELKTLLREYQVLILSGGVSMGKFDYVHGLMGDLKVKTVFHKIKQRPGKPMLFGVGEKKQLVFGLPGNPVSSLICLRRYVVEAFKEKMGRDKSGTTMAVLTEDVSFKKELTLFKGVKTSYDDSGKMLATPVLGNGSGDFASLARSDGFLELQSDKPVFKKGEVYPIYLWEGQ